jgi:hypothetical protein
MTWTSSSRGTETVRPGVAELPIASWKNAHSYRKHTKSLAAKDRVSVKADFDLAGILAEPNDSASLLGSKPPRMHSFTNNRARDWGSLA